jgi:ammonia channel protein AmtB
VTSVPNGDYAYWVSQNVFSMYQLMFAIITPALIVGAIAERMKYSAIMAFITLWMFVVYFPLAHIGVLAGAVPYFACTKLKSIFKYDDALDTFGVHGVGGTMGALLTGFFATADVNANLSTNLAAYVGKGLWMEQVKAIGVTMILAIGATTVLGYGLKFALGLRPSLENEEQGLDATDHGEAAYHPDEGGGHGEVAEGAALQGAAVAVKLQRAESA